MKLRLIAAILLTMVVATSHAGNNSKKYRSHLTEQGMLYFIEPQEMPKSKGSKATKALDFDITMIDRADSVTFRVTVHSQQAFSDSHVTLVTADSQQVKLPATPIYRDIEKNGFTNRIEFKMHIEKFRQLYDQPLPYSLSFGQGNTFSYTASKWKKHRQLTTAILQLIELNK